MSKIAVTPPPKEGNLDKAIAIGRAILGDIVPGGGTLAELAFQFVRTPYQRRAQEWEEQLGDALNQLGQRLQVLSDKQAKTLEDLQADPTFVDTVMHASLVAVRNAGEEKRRALRNAVINAGLPLAPDESQRQMFLNYIDTFTPWHLRLLALFNEPLLWYKRQGKPWPNITAGARTHILESAYPEIAGNQEFYRQVWKDLHTSGLVATDSLGGMMSGHGLTGSVTTSTGQLFLKFIGEPA